ncbi:CPCC family cysteine-rich protein [Saccharomonospora azurea]|uniref:CPCC family cysteine-rich protein n=1 Tax=Saccharomonospora azurea TaxID=40988 RepID=UPI003D8EBD7E
MIGCRSGVASGSETRQKETGLRVNRTAEPHRACCGCEVHDEPPDSHPICPVCHWEGDLVQLRWPPLRDGAHEVALYRSPMNPFHP